MAHLYELGLTQTPPITIGILPYPFSLDGYLTLTLDLSDTSYFVVDISKLSTTHVESQYGIRTMLHIRFLETLRLCERIALSGLFL